MIEIRWEICCTECLQGDGEGVMRLSAIKCKAALEALALDVWSMRDWLINDPSSGLDGKAVDAFLNSAGGYHIRACGDLATRVKHFAVGDPKKHLLHLEKVAAIEAGVPIIFKALRVFQDPAATHGAARLPTGSTDEYQDAVEMVRRAKEQWRFHLESTGLLLA